MPAGELGPGDRFVLDEAMRKAEQACRYEFSVFLGRAEGDPRAFATSLHHALVVPERSILIMVDPVQRALEIVTGSEVRQTLSDNETELAALHMREAFAIGDLVGGLKHGIGMLAEHARPPHYLHAD